MDWAIIIVLQIFFQPSLSVLFTVRAEQTKYTSEFGGDVVMGCSFDPKPSDPQNDLKVTWHWNSISQYHEVIQINHALAQSVSQKYQDRAKILLDELKDGWAKLQLSNLRISDSGTYQCLIQTADGTDYKTLTLSVVAPYTSISQRTEEAAGGEEVLLTCEAEGYPDSPVVWVDGHLHQHNHSTTISRTTDGLFKISSQIQVRSSEKNNYTCNFTKDGHSATFHIPDGLPPGKNDTVISVLCIVLVLTAIGVGVFTYQRWKAARPSRKYVVDVEENSTITCLRTNKENGCEEMFIEGHTKENLGSYLKGFYSEMSLSAETRRSCESFPVEELLQRMQNNEGQSVTLQDLLPEVSDVLLLEGPSGSGKTTIAHILVSSWTEGPKHTASNLIDLSVLDLLVYLNCSTVKGDFSQEMERQLSLREKKSEELRTVLSSSNKTLLLLDGYKEGNHLFDETLRRFLSERGSCRVLVTSCLGDCPALKQTLGTEALLKLQIQPAKY